MRRHLIPRERRTAGHRPPSPAPLLPHSQTTGLPGQSIGTVLSETVATADRR